MVSIKGNGTRIGWQEMMRLSQLPHAEPFVQFHAGYDIRWTSGKIRPILQTLTSRKVENEVENVVGQGFPRAEFGDYRAFPWMKHDDSRILHLFDLPISHSAMC
jgi:hypothetical protein